MVRFYILSILLGLTGVASAQAGGGLQQVQDFGPNSSGARMFVYKPNNLPEKPAIVVGIHYCSGTAQKYYNGSPYKGLADQKRFIVIYPESPYSGGCWDVSSKATLTRDGGANSNSIANMVKYTIKEFKADPSKVFVVGESSGGMMTNVLASTYPDLFAAAIVYSGVPAGCFFTNTVNGWNNSCSSGQVHATPERWAQWVFDAYPGYHGSRPRMQIYHGSADTTLASPNYMETIKQWSGVFGYDSSKPESQKANTPQSGYTTSTYGDHLIGVYAQNVGHGVPVHGVEDVKFFGL
ncbi:carbohydrate esterase family 1 protein [Zopfia rhizophila CBS 207.26]|uniref:Carboxylic ester hydrolase n=1 Tax=Zopfia rhizophila CBS 207.26 TaxID=1314779 RepID=A0A6A6EG72_9PEZI|nr:carbohydrate esterase family 1 protein [Zopfia rhizophila CBS 207.26]